MVASVALASLLISPAFGVSGPKVDLGLHTFGIRTIQADSQGTARAKSGLAAGPMLAYATMTEVCVWVQTSRSAKVTVEYRIQPDQSLVTVVDEGGTNKVATKKTPPNPAWVASKQVVTTSEGDHIAKILLTDLEMGAAYDYRVRIDGRLVDLGYSTVFKTQPHWRWRSDPPEFSVAIGSCLYVNQPETDRPGTPYGGDYDAIFESITKQKPDMMLWLGDNIYYREMDWVAESAMRSRWRHNRSLPSMQNLLGNALQIGTWDDHDFGPNDSDRSFQLKDEALRVFSDYFPMPNRGHDGTKGVFTKFEYGHAEFFLLDDRYHRSPNRTPAGEPKVMFGREQMQWLKDSLVSSNATFKIIVGGNQLLQPAGGNERFGAFAEEQKDLFDFLVKAKITGLLFLSGDRHHTELLKVRWPGAEYDWFEFTSSPLGSGGSRNAREENNPARVDGTWITAKRNFGLLQFKGKGDAMTLTMSSYLKDGSKAWEQVVKAADLGVRSRN
jgi:alkaline phosphatase D